MPLHVKKGDTVMVTAGNDRGVTAEVLKVIPDRNRVVVKGVNIRAKHIKPTQTNPQGGIVRREMPIHISNVSPVVDGKPTRVRFVTKDDGAKVRVAARDGSDLHVLHGPRTGAAAPAGTRKRTSRKKTTAKKKKKKTVASRAGKRSAASTGTKTKKKTSRTTSRTRTKKP